MKNWSSTVTFWRNGNATQLQQLRHSPGVADRRRMHGMLSISAGVQGGRNYSDGSRELGSGIFWASGAPVSKLHTSLSVVRDAFDGAAGSSRGSSRGGLRKSEVV